MAKRIVYLQLAPEFGGTKFGPFPGAEIRLGSDPGRNDIVLPEALGVAPEHARLVKQPDESFVLAPVERTAHLYVYRADGRAPKQVTSPMAVVGGDGFSVVSPEGPRFVIVLETAKQAAAQDGGKDSFNRAKQKLGKRSMMDEIKRQGLTRVLTTGAGQLVANTWTFIKSGAILQPRYIIMGITIAFGWVIAGGIGCTAIGLGYSQQKTAAALDECNSNYSAAVGQSDGGGELTLTDVVSKLLLDKSAPQTEVVRWKRTLEDDPALKKLVFEKIRNIIHNRDRYAWVQQYSSSPFIEFRRRLDSSNKMPKHVTRTLAYVAAHEGWNRDRDWEYVVNSKGDRVCGRGPLLMTWRQAKNLKFYDVQLDAPVDARTASQGNLEELRQRLLATAGTTDVRFEAEQINAEQGDVLGGQAKCVFVEGDDNRREINKMVPVLEKELGAAARKMPDADSGTHAVAKRIMKYYAADFELGFDEIDYSQAGQPPSAVLSAMTSLTPAEKQFAIDHTAEVMARAAAIPCLAMMDKKTQNIPLEVSNDFPKSKVTCGLLLFMIEEGEF